MMASTMDARAIYVAAIPIPLFSPRHFPSRSVSTAITTRKPPISLSSTPRTDGAFLVSAIGRRGGGRRKGATEERELSDEEEWEEDDEEEGLTPFDQMRKWMRNKPAGFGEGKTYDVSLEEELMEDIERSRKAQAANINKLKSSGGDTVVVAPKKKQQQQQIKVADVAPNGVRAHIGNLPKKRNIRRDLQSVFKAFPGIININPATTGNKKTRDPVCRGFAFVDFESEEAANRFVKAYSKQRLVFGKVEKQITCHVLSSGCSSKSDSETLFSETASTELSNVVTDGTSLESDTCSMSLKFQEENSVGYDGNEVNEPKVLPGSFDNLQVTSQPTYTEISIESSDISIMNFEETTSHQYEVDLASENSSSSTDMLKKRSAVPKKKTKKTKKTRPQEGPKVNMPGSANRLKVKERDVLTDVFSKYGGKAAALAK